MSSIAVKLISYLKKVYRADCCEHGWRTYCRRGTDIWCLNGRRTGIESLVARNQPHFVAFMADPFIFHCKGTNWIFYETVGPECVDSGLKGKIGCLKDCGGHWENVGVVLDLPWHLSYPQVFEEEGHVYMIPEQSALGQGDVSIYEAVDFPHKWIKRKTLIAKSFADSTLLVHNGHYYLACYMIPPHESAELWHAPALMGPWTRHPASGNILQDAKYRRCGGRFLSENGQIYRVAQDCEGGYGIRLYKIPIRKISSTEYEEGEPELLLDEFAIIRSRKHTYNTLVADGVQIEVFDCHWFTQCPFLIIVQNLFRKIVRRLSR